MLWTGCAWHIEAMINNDAYLHTQQESLAQHPRAHRDKLSPIIIHFLLRPTVYLLCHSIRENILNGERGASEEDMIAAAKAAYIHDFIMTLEKGYDSQVCHIYTHAFKCLCRQVCLHTRALPRSTRLVKRALRFPAVRSSALPSQGPLSKIRLFCFWTRPQGRRGNILSVPRKHFLDHSRRRVFIPLLHACSRSALDSESEELVAQALKALSVCLVVVQPFDRHSERPMPSSTPQQHATLL